MNVSGNGGPIKISDRLAPTPTGEVAGMLLEAASSLLANDTSPAKVRALILAAPELLEALRDVTKWADAVIGEPDKAMGEQTFGNSAIKAAVAAIKRAGG